LHCISAGTTALADPFPAIKAQMIERGYVAEGYCPDVVDMCAPAQALPGP
jgi:hypothetical protein